MEKRNNIKSIVKASQVMEALAYDEKPISLAELSTRLNMAKSTLHGIISTLVDINFVEQDQESGRYKLGVHLFELGAQIANTWNEKAIAHSYMKQMAEKTGETIHLAMLSHGEVLYVDKQEANSAIRIVTAPGAKLPAHCTGVGKVLLAYSKQEDLDQILSEFSLDQYTAYTITNKKALEKELKKIRADGYAYDNQEYLDGLRCISAPIFNHNGKVIFALSISGPLFRMSDITIERYLKLLLHASQEISHKLGYRS